MATGWACSTGWLALACSAEPRVCAENCRGGDESTSASIRDSRTPSPPSDFQFCFSLPVPPGSGPFLSKNPTPFDCCSIPLSHNPLMFNTLRKASQAVLGGSGCCWHGTPSACYRGTLMGSEGRSDGRSGCSGGRGVEGRGGDASRQ